MKVFGIICFLFFTRLLFAQPPANELDILVKQYHELPKDSLKKRANALEKIAVAQYTRYNNSKQWTYIDTLIQVYVAAGDSLKVYKTKYHLLGKANNEWLNMPEAILLYQKYAEYLRKHKREKEDAYFYLDFGNAYYKLRLYRAARQYYQKAEQLLEAEKDYKGLRLVYDQYVILAGYEKQPDTAVYYSKKSFEIQQQYTQDSFATAFSLFTLANQLFLAKQWEPARYAALRSYAMLSDTRFLSYDGYAENKYQPFLVAILTAQIYSKENKLDTALYYLDQAKQQLNLHQLEAGWEVIDFGTAAVYYKQQKIQEAIKLCEHILAEVDKGVRPIFNKQKILLDVYPFLQRIYNQLNNESKSYEYGYKYYLVQDSFNKSKYTDQLLVANNLVMQMENDRLITEQQQEIEQQQAQVAAEQYTKNLLSVITILVVIILLFGMVFLIQLRRKNKLIVQYSQELEQSNATKEILLSVIGHDLRAPFNSIFRTLQLAEIQHQNNEYLQSIQQSSRHAFALLDSLMQWVSVQKEQLQAHPKMVSIPNLLDDILKPLDKLAILNNLKITSQLPITAIQTDQDMLHIILRNLLFNAIKYSPAQSTIVLQSFEQDGQIGIRIRNESSQLLDTNIGTDYRTIAKKGSGLGLLLVQEFAERLGIRFMMQIIENTQVVCTLLFDKKTIFATSTDVAHTDLAIPNISLATSDWEYLQTMINKIKPYELYEGTTIKSILEEIPTNASPAIQHWKQQVLQAIYQLNQGLFSKLLNLR